jgi:hypothetical protein
MRQFMMTIMALTAFGAMIATAQADAIQGGPMRNGNQCFKYSPGIGHDSRFGYWGACSQAASTAAAAATPRSTRRGRAAASVTSPAPRSVNEFDQHESAQ